MKKVLLLLAIVAFTSAAFASTITLSQSDLTNFTQTSSSLVSTTVQSPPGKYSTIFTSTGSQTATITNSTLSIAYNGGDQFSLFVNNVNENPWDFSVCVNGSICSGTQTIANGSSYTFLFGLGASGGTITSVSLNVGSNGIPIGGTDATAEYMLTPEPGSMAMLGSGILGLAGLIRRKIVR